MDKHNILRRYSLTLDEAIEAIDVVENLGHSWEYVLHAELENEARKRIDKMIGDEICRLYGLNSKILMNHTYRGTGSLTLTIGNDSLNDDVLRDILTNGFWRGFAYPKNDKTPVEFELERKIQSDEKQQELYDIEAYVKLVLVENLTTEAYDRRLFGYCNDSRTPEEVKQEFETKFLEALGHLGIDSFHPRIQELREEKSKLEVWKSNLYPSSEEAEQYGPKIAEINEQLARIYARQVEL